VPEDELDTTLVFDSRFESGNLEEARRVGEYVYDLRLQTDLYTARHTQWYYFCVSNVKKGATYTFNITNLLKPDSLYNHGMQPCTYSEAVVASTKVGWVRSGTNVRYHKSKRKVESTKQERQTYTLSWQYVTAHSRLYLQALPSGFESLAFLVEETLAQPAVLNFNGSAKGVQRLCEI
jgi:hypothetical protein